MAENSDLKEKDVYSEPCFNKGQKGIGDLEARQLK